MKQNTSQAQLTSPIEQISLARGKHEKYRFLAVILICCGLFLAAFAVSAVYLRTEQGEAWLERIESLLGGDRSDADEPSTAPNGDASTTPAPNENEPIPTPIPEGATAIVTLDLSRPDLGKEYIHNETLYDPDVSALLSRPIGGGESTSPPTVLIIHTHTSEAYLPGGTQYVEGAVGDRTYSREEAENVLSVGSILCQRLNEKGITAIHCTVMHDDPSLSGSYARSAETVKHYLALYPEIEYVIDLHRDAVTTASGELVRSVGKDGEDAIAQILAVVGTDGNGTEHPRWVDNLALALRLRELLNTTYPNLCRPVSLRNASFNQELAPYSILLEIGTCANSPEEAKRAAVLLADALAELIYLR